ncbi:MAG: hypothetical protein V3T53_09280 [Phycisphaerales bacterium]
MSVATRWPLAAIDDHGEPDGMDPHASVAVLVGAVERVDDADQGLRSVSLTSAPGQRTRLGDA